MAFDTSSAIVVDLPVRGVWSALNTPAHRVPSHGTDYLGQRYAYDFVQLDADGIPCPAARVLRHLTIGTVASDFYCWNQPVVSAFAGKVVSVGEGWPDRSRVAAVWELIRGTLFPPSVRRRDYRPLAGNFVVIEGDPGVAFYAHLRAGSVSIVEGQVVAVGDQIGRVGNSGNSTMPHLHFQLMDDPDPLAANGLPCVFRRYERFVDGEWKSTENDAPRRLERFRTT